MDKKKRIKESARRVVSKDFLQELMVQDLLNDGKALEESPNKILQVIAKGIDIQIWKDGHKYKIVKEILPHAKTAEKDSIESLNKEATIKKITEFVTKLFDVKN